MRADILYAVDGSGRLLHSAVGFCLPTMPNEGPLTEYPYEASAASTFAVLLGYEAGAAAAETSQGSPPSELPGVVVGLHGYDKTKHDRAWGDAIAQVGNIAALIEFKRTSSRRLLGRELEKGKIHIVTRLEASHREVVQHGHLLAFGGKAFGAVRYRDIQQLYDSGDAAGVASYISLPELARALGRGESGVPLQALKRYLAALSSEGAELRVTGYLVVRGPDGHLLVIGVDGSVRSLVSALQPLRSRLAARADESLSSTPAGPSDRKSPRHGGAQ